MLNYKLLSLFLLLHLTSYGQLIFNEDFNYNTGTFVKVCNDNWGREAVVSDTVTISSQKVTSGSLTYPNYNTLTNNSNKLSILPDLPAEGTHAKFTIQNKGTLYFSFLLRVNNIKEAFGGDSYLMNPYGTNRNFKLNIKKGSADSTFKLVIRGYQSGPYVESNNISFGMTHLIVIAQQFDSDSTLLWIDPSTKLKPSASLFFKVSDNAYKITNLYQLIIRSTWDFPSSDLFKLNCDIDAIRIGLTWEDIMGLPTYNIKQVNTSNSITGEADSTGVRTILHGVVHRYNQTTSGLKFLLYDHTGGITIMNTNKTFGYIVGEGDSLEVKGTIGTERGLVVLNADTLILKGSFMDTHIPIVSTQLNETTENKLVFFNQLQFINKPTIGTWSVGTYYTKKIGGIDTITLTILQTSPLNGKKIPITNAFTAIGIGTQTSTSTTAPFAFNGYALIPMRLTDIIADSALNINDIHNTQLSIYPNPNNGIFTVNSTQQGEYKIINEIGQTIQSFKAINADNNLNLDISSEPDGIYFLHFISINKTFTYKLIKN